MATYVVTNVAGTLKSSTYPTYHYGGHYSGSSKMTFCIEDDLFTPDADVLSLPNKPVYPISANPISVQPEFFGMHVKNRDNDSFTELNFKTVRSHDMAGGKGRWQFIEPSDSTNDSNIWNFTDLDLWVNTHYNAGRDIIFTLFATPQWASARPNERNAYSDHDSEPYPYNRGICAEPLNMAHWDRYCAKIAQRYSGKIKYYEVWNEPNYQNDGTGPSAEGLISEKYFFSGSWQKLSEMTRRANQTIKAIDPEAKIISSATTVWTKLGSTNPPHDAKGYFIGMMNASDGISGTMKDWIDIVGVHLYLPGNNDITYLPGMIDNIKDAMSIVGISSLPIWDTESAPINPLAINLSDGKISQYLFRTILIMAGKGIKRTMYYQLDDTLMGFLGRTDIYLIWEEIRDLLINNKINAISMLFDGRIVFKKINNDIEII